MGNYLSISHVQDRLHRTVDTLYDDDGSPNTDWIEADIATVEGLIDGHLAVRYSTPIAVAAALPLLRGLALDLFLAQAYRRSAAAAPPPGAVDVERRAMELLADLAAGRLQLGGVAQPAPMPGIAEALVVEGNRAEMTRGRLAGF